MNIFRKSIWMTIGLFVLVTWGTAAENPRITVLTYNIHHGEGIDGKLDIKRIADVINSVTPDLVALQEVDVKTKRVQGADQPDQLSRLTGLTAHFSQAIPYDGGMYGIAVLVRDSQFRFLAGFVNQLPYSEGREQRVVNERILELQNDSVSKPMIRFYCTHLDHLNDEQDRLPSAMTINEWVGKDPVRWQGAEKMTFDPQTPSILAGDLNAEPDSRTIRELQKSWAFTEDLTTSFTWPSEKPNIRIDYILFRPQHRWRVIESRVLDEKVASDHRPYLTILELLPEK